MEACKKLDILWSWQELSSDNWTYIEFIKYQVLFFAGFLVIPDKKVLSSLHAQTKYT